MGRVNICIFLLEEVLAVSIILTNIGTEMTCLFIINLKAYNIALMDQPLKFFNAVENCIET